MKKQTNLFATSLLIPVWRRVRTRLWLGVALSLLCATPGMATEPQANARFIWMPFRLREVATLDNQLRQNRQTVLFKLDTATGKAWLYDVDSITLTADGHRDDAGHFRPIDVEGLVRPAPPPTPPIRGKKPEKPVLENGRFGFTMLTLPRAIRDVTGERRGVTERDELFLIDTTTGYNWIFKPLAVVIEDGDRKSKSWRNQFSRVFNADERVLVEGDPRAKAPEKKPYRLKRSTKEWMDLFVENQDGKTLRPRNIPSVDAVIVLSKDDTFTPLVVMRSNLTGERAVGVSPWQAELYSDAAVDWLCQQEPVDLDSADRYVIFINTEGRTARGFNPLQTHMIGGMPDHDRIGKLLRVD